MRRVSVIGPSCSGKTTFARALAARLDVPFVELDSLFWAQGNWVKPEVEVFRERVARAIDSSAWVVEGGYHGWLGTSVQERADTVVWLDIPLPVRLWRVLRRAIPRALRREELWGGNRETFRNLFLSRDSLLYYSVRTHRGSRRRYETRLAKPEMARATVHRFRSSRDADRWLGTLPRQ